MINDYKNWYNSKQEIFHHLQHHNSLIIRRIENVRNTLNFITKLKEEEMNEDYSIIFDCGYNYLYQVVSEIEFYLDKYFDNNVHKFLDYELLIDYLLYLTDFKEALLENECFNEQLNEDINFINSNIENILSTKRMFTEKVLDEYDNRILASMTTNKSIYTTPEVYDRIYEELQILDDHNRIEEHEHEHHHSKEEDHE